MFNFHHVALSVSNLERSIHFYQQLGFEEKYRWQANDDTLSIAHLMLNGAALELFCYNHHTPAPESSHNLATDLPRLGVKHFGLKTDNILETKSAFEQSGIARDITVTKGRTGVEYFFIKDPDGILLEIVQDNRAL